MALVAVRMSVRRETSKRSRNALVRRFWNIPLFVVCITSFCLYLPSLGSGFIHDDHFQIVKNPQIQSWDNLPRLLTTDV
jgi:hypothetical protein